MVERTVPSKVRDPEDASVSVELVYKIRLVPPKLVTPVPPLPTERVPVISVEPDDKFMAAAATEPLVAFRKPERDPMERLEANRFVELAVVLKKLVEVAEGEVELIAVKFWRVEEAVARRLVRVARPETERVEPTDRAPVVVAFVVVELPVILKLPIMVEEAEETNPPLSSTVRVVVGVK